MIIINCIEKNTYAGPKPTKWKRYTIPLIKVPPLYIYACYYKLDIHAHEDRTRRFISVDPSDEAYYEYMESDTLNDGHRDRAYYRKL